MENRIHLYFKKNIFVILIHKQEFIESVDMFLHLIEQLYHIQFTQLHLLGIVLFFPFLEASICTNKLCIWLSNTNNKIV